MLYKCTESILIAIMVLPNHLILLISYYYITVNSTYNYRNKCTLPLEFAPAIIFLEGWKQFLEQTDPR